MATEPKKYKQDGQNYSLDEMMDRLRSDEQEKLTQKNKADGELVTRKDGSQALKVRKRRRRSVQPDKNSNNLSPKVKWTILAGTLGVGIIFTAAIIFIIAKYNGRSFKEKTESIIAEITNAQKSEISKLRITPISAKATTFSIDWGNHTFLKRAEFNNLRSDIKPASFITSKWKGPEIVTSTGQIYLQKPLLSAETTSDTSPSPYDFGSYRCNQLDIYFGQNPDAPAIKELQISLRKTNTEIHQIVFQGGKVIIPDWPDCRLSSGIITLNAEDAQIETLISAENSKSGALKITGRIPKNTQKNIKLNVKATNYPIHELLGTELGKLVLGNVQSDLGEISYDYDNPSASGLKFSLPFNSNYIRITSFPFLTILKDFTNNSKYVRPSFTNCEGDIIRTASGVSLNNIDFVSNSLISLLGDIHVGSDRKLSGTLDVGIPVSAFIGSPPKPFTGPRDGLYYVKLTLSGTIQNPHDNLRELLSPYTRAKENLPRPRSHTELLRTPTPNEKMEDAFENLSR